MKKLIIAALALLFANNLQAQTSYGKEFDTNGAITMDELAAKMPDGQKTEATVTAKIESVCQAMGCWMKVAKSNGETMMVKMKDHKFYLPKDIAGKTAIMTGVAEEKTTSVEMLKHYAEDEGKSQAEIDAIKDAKKEVIFTASGVVIM